MKPLRIFRHATCEPPSYLCTYLQCHNIPFEIICLDEGLHVPDTLDDISGLVFMGGAGSVNDNKKWIIKELALIQKADQQNIPVLGICFGAQLISKALGGLVSTGKDMEIGWHDIEAVNAMSGNQCFDNPWLTDLPTRFETFQWHAHMFSTPPDATALWRNRCCEQQGFAKGNILAMQFHLEVTADSVMELSRLYASDLSLPSDCVQTAEQIVDNIEARIKRLHQTADVIYGRWLTMARLV